MNDELHHIEDLFRHALEGDVAKPPPHVWQRIGRRLDQGDNKHTAQKRGAPKRALLLAALLLAGLGIYEWHQTGYGILKKLAAYGPAAPQTGHNPASTLQDQKEKATQNKMGSIVENALAAAPATAFDFRLPQTDAARNNGYGVLKNFAQPDKTTAQVFSQRESLQQPLPDPFVIQNAAISLRLASLPVHPVRLTRQSSRFSLTAFYAPDRASYRLVANDRGTQPEDAARIQNDEHQETSYTAGLLLARPANARWDFFSGLIFANTDIRINPKTLYAQPAGGGVKYRINLSSGYGYLLPDAQAGPAVGDSLRITATAHKLRYISVPMGVRYHTQGRLRLEASAAVVANVLVTGKLETEVQGAARREVDLLNNIEGLKGWHLGAWAAVGTSYEVVPRLRLSLQPAARISLTAINRKGVVKTYPRSVGLAVGLSWRL